MIGQGHIVGRTTLRKQKCKNENFGSKKKLNTRHNFWIWFEKMCDYEIDPVSIVKDTERQRFRPWTDGQNETNIPLFQLCWTPWVAIQASRCAGRVDRILAVKNPSVSLCHSYENGGREVPPGLIAVLLQDIPGGKGILLIRYPI